MYDLMEKGGPVMWPLLLCSLVSMTVVIERLWWLYARRLREDAAGIDSLLRRAEAGEFEAAATMGKTFKDPVARLLADGIAQRDHGMSQTVEDAAQEQIHQTRRGLFILDTIITLAPLLGILGTVLGIIKSFNLLGDGGLEDPQAVTGGIAEALITTAAGLTVAVLTLVPYNYFVAHVERYTRRLQKFATQLEIACSKGREQNDATA